MRDAFHAVLRSLAFLTRLPAPARAFAAGPHRLGDDAFAFAPAGLVLALPSGLVLIAADGLELSVPTGAIMALALLVFLTGALHEDGLADVADGLGGQHPKERALHIMKDSRIGTYGGVTLFFALLLRVSLLADVAAVSAGSAALGLVAAASASRGLMAWLWSSLPTADTGGLADSVGQPSPRAGLLAAAIGAAMAVVAGLAASGLVAAVLPFALAGVALALFRRFLLRRLGGQTGDCLGAAQQITEIALLLGFAIALRAG